jgi:hypothetical protein
MLIINLLCLVIANAKHQEVQKIPYGLNELMQAIQDDINYFMDGQFFIEEIKPIFTSPNKDISKSNSPGLFQTEILCPACLLGTWTIQ